MARRSREQTRLDPVRWRRPGRGALLRLGAIAALLLTAALISWSGPETCAAPAPSAPRPSNSTSTPGGPSGLTTSGPQPSARARMPPGTVGVPVRLAEPTALTLVHPGDKVDLLGEKSNAIAAAALVLGVTGADDPTAGGLLLALTPAEAAKAVAEPPGAFAVLLRP